MRVSLIHNSHSGSKDHTAESIARTIRDSGHEVVGVAHSLAELAGALKRDQTELVAVAGGDGTVSRTACALAGSHVPLAILPHGTANNIALDLGIRGSVEELVAGWRHAQTVPFDLFDVTVDGHATRLAEAVGWGVFPTVIAEAKRREEADRAAVRSLDDERALFRRLLVAARPRPYEVSVNGVNCSGDYLLVEVSNVRFIGPRLLLAPDSSSADGLLDVTLWGESERRHLDRLLDPDQVSPSERSWPPARRGDRVTVRATDSVRHGDGQLLDRETDELETVQVSVRPAAVHCLVG